MLARGERREAKRKQGKEGREAAATGAPGILDTLYGVEERPPIYCYRANDNNIDSYDMVVHTTPYHDGSNDRGYVVCRRSNAAHQRQQHINITST